MIEQRRLDSSITLAVTLLLAHAIELYLKAFLRLRGLGIDEVRDSFGHDFKKLVNEAGSRGLDLMDEDMDIAAILTRERVDKTIPLHRDGLLPAAGTRRPVAHLPKSRPICLSRIQRCGHGRSTDRTQPHRG